MVDRASRHMNVASTVLVVRVERHLIATAVELAEAKRIREAKMNRESSIVHSFG